MIILVAASVVGLYYYLRVLVVMYARPREPGPEAARSLGPRRSYLAGGIGLAILVLLLLGLGIFPSGLIEMIKRTVATLAGVVHPPGA